MTFEQFKKDFEACENGKAFSDEFRDVINEIQCSFGGINYESANALLIKGIRPETSAFAFTYDGRALLIRQDVFDRILIKFSNRDKSEIITYCFCKYFSIDFSEVLHLFPCKQSEISWVVENDKYDFYRPGVLVDEDTAELFSSNLLNLHIDKTTEFNKRNLTHYIESKIFKKSKETINTNK